MDNCFADEISGWRLGSDGKRYNLYVDNHHTTDEDIILLNSWIKTLLDIFNNQIIGNSDEEIKICENKLGVNLPFTLRQMYKNFGQDEKFMKNRLEKRNIISLSDLLISENRIAFKKQGNYLWGVDIQNDRLNHYDKGWYWDKGSMSLVQEIIVSLFHNRLSNMQNVIYSRLKGYSGLRSERKAIEDFKEYMQPLNGFALCDHMIFYNKSKNAIGWFRGNCSMVDLLVGCDDFKFVDELSLVFNLNSKYKFLNDKKN